jgi:hypothetical protein
MRFFVSAVWSSDLENEPTGDLCDWEMLVLFPGEDSPRTMGSGQFKFSTMFRRIDVLFQTMLGSPQQENRVKLRSGVLRFTSRVRLAESDTWLSQDYAVPIQVGLANESHDVTPEEVEKNG